MTKYLSKPVCVYVQNVNVGGWHMKRFIIHCWELTSLFLCVLAFFLNQKNQSQLLGSWKVSSGCIWRDLHACCTLTHTVFIYFLHHVWAVEQVKVLSWILPITATRIERKTKNVEQSAGEKRQGSDRKCERERERYPTIFSSSEQNGVAWGAVTNLCERQHLQHVHCIFLESPDDHWQNALPICQLNTGGTSWILLVVQHLYIDTIISIE